jgi:hypothetical protein
MVEGSTADEKADAGRSLPAGVEPTGCDVSPENDGR